jgi:hypothetical protein
MKKLKKFESKLEKKLPRWVVLFFSATLFVGLAFGNIQSSQDQKDVQDLRREYELRKQNSMAELNYQIRFFSVPRNK